MSSQLQSATNKQIVITIHPEQVQNKNKRTTVTKDACSAIIAFLNDYQSGQLVLRSSTCLTPAAIDELVRGIEQTVIEFVGLTRFRECSRTNIDGSAREITFSVQPGGRIYTVEYNLVLPTDFQVRPVSRMDPLESVAPLLKAGPLDNSNLQSYVREFQKDTKVSDNTRESDEVQFKRIKSDKNKNKSTADRIIANKITHYVAAFANHKGGHVYIGIDDETYVVCGQIVVEEEQQRILDKVGVAISNMVWPEGNGKPERGKHWDMAFVPVLNDKKELIHDLFVIVISVACCPGGVFLSLPESYEIENGKVVRMKFDKWKKRILHDAHMRDIVKFCRENAWGEMVGHHTPRAAQRNSDLLHSRDSCASTQIVFCNSEREFIPSKVPAIKPTANKCKRACQRVTDYMQQLIQDGEFIKLENFALESLGMPELFGGADIKVTIRFMLALGAYRRRDFSEAYKHLSEASASISSTENQTEFEVQRLHLLACFLRGEGEYSKSYEVSCDGLQTMESISPGWHTAWMLNDTGYLFSILAGEETNEEVHESLKQQARHLYSKAIAHTYEIENGATQSVDISIMKTNLLHRCHLRLAMVSLDCTPLVQENRDASHVSCSDIDVAIANILAVEKSSLKEDSLTDVNECYLFLVKSDLNYQKSQLDGKHCEKFRKKSKGFAEKARELANNKFPRILKYSESRLRRVSNATCHSSREEMRLADLLK